MPSQSEMEDFFSDKKILILDNGRATRETIKSILLEYKIKQENIFATDSFDKSIAIVKNEKPDIVFTDIEIDKHSGLQLLHEVSEYAPSMVDRLFYVITGNADETAVAEAAEEDVDCYILKPFSKDAFIDYLERTVDQKLHPSEYISLIEQGKMSLIKKDLDEALNIFGIAKAMSDSPSLACFYVGEVHRLKKNSLNALLEYEEGLEINSIHYRCLVGKFETLDELKQTEEAYDVVKVLTKHFPVSPQRLGKIFKLSVFTQNFSDAKRYYDLFEKIEHKSFELRKIVAAALKVSGKFLVNHQDVPGAMEAFKNAIITSKLDPIIINNVVEFLVEHDLAKEAAELLKLYPADDRISAEFQNLDFKVLQHLGNQAEALRLGNKLVDENLAEAHIYESLAQIFVEQGRADAAENILYQGIQNHPDQREHFSKLLEKLENQN